ncbi:MFS transporter [Siminovitchia sediminis]|uniref:MFS transporter n=1 Tax=Siminovitchia sediminis TaxID=1274353 RepID=A0ABW4KIX2_9BACI
MRQINVAQVVDDSKVNSLHLTVLLWCIFIIVFDGFDLAIYGAVIPSLSQLWSLNPGVVGFIGSLSLIGSLIGALTCGIIADKIGRKKVIIACVLLFSVFSIMTGLSNGPVDFAIYRFIAGLGLGGVGPLVVVLTSEYSPKSKRSMMVGIMYSGFSIGGILVALSGLVVIPNLGWQWMYYIGALPLISIPILIKYLPESLAYYVVKGEREQVQKILKRLNPSFTPKSDDVYEVNLPKTGMPVVQLFKERRGTTTIMFWIICFMGLLMTYGLSTWLPQLMIKAGYPLNSSLLFMFALNLGAILGAIAGGWLADRIGSKKVLVGLFGFGAICLSLLGFNPGSAVLYFLIIVSGAASIGAQIIANGYISKFYPAHIRSTALGWAIGIGRFGAILGPSIGGLLLELSLPIYMNFIVFAIPALLAALATWNVRDRYSDFHQIKADSSKDQAVM